MKDEFALDQETVDAVLHLGRLALQFGLVERKTYHPDGVTPESDTTHTVMLALLACAFADRFAQHLNRGRIAEFALVHDFVEVYAGDVPTIRDLSLEDKRQKDENEHQALLRLREELGKELPWVADTMEEYESLSTPEARFVKTLDKVLPKITHYFNEGAMLKVMGIDGIELKDIHTFQHEKIQKSYGHDQEEALCLYRALSENIRKELFPVESD